MSIDINKLLENTKVVLSDKQIDEIVNRAENGFKAVVLTPHQEEIKNKVLEALLDEESTKTKIVLSGSAGTGKTTCVNAIIEEYMRKKRDRYKTMCYVLAPTNKAVNVLIEKNKPEFWKEFQTVHRALNLKRRIDNETGLVSYKPDKWMKNRPFESTALVVIDESSMLSKEMIGYLDKHKIPMIFLGDAKQLPPVGEAESSVFTLPDAVKFELTEIVRQAQGNPIIELSQNLPLISLEEDNINDIGGYRFTKNLNKCVQLLLDNIGDSKYLAWTNANVDEVNSLVRLVRYGEHAAMIEIGETLVMTEPFTNKETYYTSEEIDVETLIIREHNISVTCTGKQRTKDCNSVTGSIKYYLLNTDIMVVHEDSKGAYGLMLKKLKSYIDTGIASWKDFYGFKEKFAHVAYSYALTVHKSQGSTYKKVIINVRDLNKNRTIDERNKLWYTAITRASGNIILLT